MRGSIITTSIGKSSSYPNSSALPNLAITLSHPSVPPKRVTYPAGALSHAIAASGIDRKSVKRYIP